MIAYYSGGNVFGGLLAGNYDIILIPEVI